MSSRWSRIAPRSHKPSLELLENRLLPALYVVNTTADTTGVEGELSLREAIQDANINNSGDGNDSITFDATVFNSAQSILLSNGALPTVTDQSLTITGPAARLTIDARHDSGILVIDSGATVSICGLTLTGGSASVGGAIDNSGSLSLANCTVSGNSAEDGGGIANESGAALKLCDTTLRCNSAWDEGGGLANAGCAEVQHSRIAGNFAGSAGGGLLSTDTAFLLVRDSTVCDNGTCGDGGGLAVGGVDPLVLIDCTVSGNWAGGDGGGLDLGYGTSATLCGCTVSGNTAGAAGGGVYSAADLLCLTNCTLANNYAGDQGGGLASGDFFTDVTNLTNCTVSGNSVGGASCAGGGLSLHYGSATLVNTLVAGNTNDVGRDDISGCVSWDSHNNLVGDGTGLFGIHNGCNGNLIGNHWCPIDPLLAPLGCYGGPTQTMALLPGSPAIDAGSWCGAPCTDQRGADRVCAPDIGAFESQGFTITIVSGDNQYVEPGQTLPLPFVVQVTANNPVEPVKGGHVTFAAPGSGASGTFAGPGLTAVVTIACDGTATAPAFTTNGIQGGFTVCAAARGGNPVQFHVNNAIATVIGGNLVVVGSNGNDNITVSYLNGTFSVNFNGHVYTFTSAGRGGQVSLSGHIILYGQNTTPTGTDNLTVNGTFPAEIHAGNGSTVVHGGAGGDVIYGGALATSKLTAYAGTGADVIVAGPGVAKLYAGAAGHAVLIGGSLLPGMGFDTYADLATLAAQWAGGNAAQIAAQQTALTAAFVAGASDLLSATGGAGTWGVAAAAATFTGFKLPPAGHDKKTTF